MFTQVRLFDGFSKPLLYKVPENWEIKPSIGSIVSVPLRKQIKLAFVSEIITEPVKTNFEIRELIKLEGFPQDKFYLNFVSSIANLYQIDSIKLIKRIGNFIKESSQKSSFILPKIDTGNVELTDDQLQIYEYVKSTMGTYSPVLIHGVTGSGKTEVYKKIIELNFVQNKSSILLLPEVTLSIKFEEIFKQNLGNKLKIFGFHSGTSTLEKRALWQSLMNNENILIIGVHLPVLLPISNLGLIVVDEEHEKGYQEKKHPKINSKEAAILRASLYNIPVVCGSATPSFSSLHNVRTRSWKFFQLKKRFSGKLPEVKIVELVKSKKTRQNFWISSELQNAIKDRLDKKEQIIIFINRRGYSFFVQCKNCAYIFMCKNCSISLTLHENNFLICHYCGLQQALCRECPSCKKDEFIKKGIGTQQAVSILKGIFPEANIERADMDMTVKKESWKNTIKQFEDGQIDILVGTQTLTKGYHFPNVTLVGILWADLNLNFPAYNASEVCLQQLIQVAGRAGRSDKDSLVIIQIMNDTKLTDFLNEIDYLKFYEHETKNRKLIGYPPFVRFAEIELKHSDEDILVRDTQNIYDALIAENNSKIDILGPINAPVFKIKNHFSKKIYLKSNNLNSVIKLFESVNKKNIKSAIYFTPNPV